MIVTSKKIRSYLNQVKFYFGLEPVIERSNKKSYYIPPDKKAVVLISVDFELAWASRYKTDINDPLSFAVSQARIERENIPKILDLCEHFRIPLTWATVGHLFLGNCSANEAGEIHAEIPLIEPYRGDFWEFRGQHWFEHDPLSNLEKDPEWYAPDLISMIIESEVQHEVGCHTFSHIDCRDDICSADVMRAELNECKRHARNLSLDLRSFVHPGHTIGNLNVLSEAGFTNFRTNYRNLLGYPKMHKNGLLEFEQTAEFSYRKEWSIDYHIFRYITIIKRAIKRSKLCVFWFHPSFNSVMVETILPAVFAYINENREELWVTTHTEYVDWLKNGSAMNELVYD
jgi:peptidoglycan/xylan/chitin deacetylase (PgdA/CDA1 family)